MSVLPLHRSYLRNMLFYTNVICTRGSVKILRNTSGTSHRSVSGACCLFLFSIRSFSSSPQLLVSPESETSDFEKQHSSVSGGKTIAATGWQEDMSLCRITCDAWSVCWNMLFLIDGALHVWYCCFVIVWLLYLCLVVLGALLKFVEFLAYRICVKANFSSADS